MPGNYDLEVRLAGTENVALSVPSVAFTRGSNVTIFATGLTGNGTLAAMPVMDVDGLFLRGDSNGDGEFNLSDPIATLSSLLLEGKDSVCGDAADADDDGDLTLADAVYSLSFLFLSGPPPAAPHPEAGIDFTLDSLGCELRPRS